MATDFLVIGSDHGGYLLKLEILKCLAEKNIKAVDVGCSSEESVDYPDYAALVAQKVSSGQAERGILVCGTGIGMAITANKFKGVRAASIFDLETARLSREHNNLNVLCLGGRVLKPQLACEIVRTFLDTPFAGARHVKRLEKIKEIENQ